MKESDLLDIILTNLEEAKQQATEWYEANKIKGAVLIVSYFDTTNSDEKSAFHGAAYRRPAHIGENAKDCFVDHLVEETVQNHRRDISRAANSVHFVERSDRVSERIIVETDGKRFDIALVAWGCKTQEQNAELVGILEKGLKESRT